MNSISKIKRTCTRLFYYYLLFYLSIFMVIRLHPVLPKGTIILFRTKLGSRYFIYLSFKNLKPGKVNNKLLFRLKIAAAVAAVTAAAVPLVSCYKSVGTILFLLFLGISSRRRIPSSRLVHPFHPPVPTVRIW